MKKNRILIILIIVVGVIGTVKSYYQQHQINKQIESYIANDVRDNIIRYGIIGDGSSVINKEEKMKNDMYGCSEEQYKQLADEYKVKVEEFKRDFTITKGGIVFKTDDIPIVE